MKTATYRSALVAAFGILSSHAAESTLEQDFRHPPTTVRPYVWWHWMGPNFSKEGITKDLEAMKACGIGGATIFNIASAVQESHKPTLNNPWPDQTYRSPKYWDALKHAADEAQRLGLEIGLHNTVGYSTTGGPWVDEEKNMQRIVSKSVTIEGGKRVSIEVPRPDPTTYGGWGNSGRSFTFFRDIAVLAVPADGVIDPAQIIDLTSSLKDNRLDWEAPLGRWQVVRLCHAPTGANPHPLPDDLIGKTLEVDKLSLEFNRFHWDQVVDPLKQHLGPHLGQSFGHFLIDSYEAGDQNWTPNFREEFRNRKGYDPLPWLLVLEKRTVGNPDLSARFQWDMADIVSTLYYENGWQTAIEKIKSVGMKLQFEPYGGPFDTVEATALADLPMGEFWTSGGGGINGTLVAAANAAGRKVIGAEAFTGPPGLSKWSETPAFLKRSADGTYASGANRLVLHHWVHQPFDDRYKPGMGMGWWGTHFNRHQTWAKDGTAFFQYLGRCQAMLQAGESPADFVSVGKSQGGDIISWREFRAGLSVRDGQIAVRSGRRYAFLGIPHDGRLTPEDLIQIRNLVEQGGVIACARPSGAPGLSGYPESDRKVASLATIWTDAPVVALGKGRLYTQADVAAARRDLKLTPLMEFSGHPEVIGTARSTREGYLFFVANSGSNSAAFTASFRVDGRRPELWDAQDGSIRLAPVWRTKNGRTEVDLTLGDRQSVFVVFRDSQIPADHVVAIEGAAAVGGLRIIKARFGSTEAGRWMDVAPRLTELTASGAIHIAAVVPGVFGRDPVPNVVKSLEIEYELGGKLQTLTVAEGAPLNIDDGTPASALKLVAAADGSVSGSSTTATAASVIFASGKRQTLTFPAPLPPVGLTGPWQVTLASPVDVERKLTLPSLISLSDHADPSAKYFSGTATYSVTFPISEIKSQLSLDLGKVHDLARVTLNGRDLGVLWRAPFTLDLTPALKVGENHLEIAVTNTWHNRLVGDEQFPADFEWGEDRGSNGHAMKAYPDWFIKNQPRPEQGRKCFVVWYYHRQDTKLLPSGLLGPVRLVPTTHAAAQP